MNQSSLSSHKLYSLLAHLWSSPVFSTSYDEFDGSTDSSILATVDAVYQRSLATLEHVLALAQPALHSTERERLIHQVVAKSVAFCGALAADSVTNIEQLRAATSAIALVSWADQTMDRGDQAMVTAIEIAAGTRTYATQATSLPVQSYAAALGWFLREVTVIARPEDGPLVLRCLLNDTLAREARMWRLSALYQRMDADQFWEEYASEAGRLAVRNVGLIAVAAMVYALHRQRDPLLPSLAEVLHNRALMEGPVRAGEAMIRMLDDIGDCAIDMGDDPAWGLFAINLWNQNDPRYVEAFFDAAGVHQPALRCAMYQAQTTHHSAEAVKLWLGLVRAVFAGLPQQLHARYGVFLRIVQRVIEAGYVNMLGDDVLAEELQERAIGM